MRLWLTACQGMKPSDNVRRLASIRVPPPPPPPPRPTSPPSRGMLRYPFALGTPRAAAASSTGRATRRTLRNTAPAARASGLYNVSLEVTARHGTPWTCRRATRVPGGSSQLPCALNCELRGLYHPRVGPSRMQAPLSARDSTRASPGPQCGVLGPLCFPKLGQNVTCACTAGASKYCDSD